MANRRDELLGIAGELFASRGFKNTTVRDIADAAGILSGSLYHHFDSKESMVDELLRTFQTGLFATYDDILARGLDGRATVDAVVRASFEAIDQHHDEVAIFQNDAGYLMGFERFSYLREHNKRFREMWTSLLADGVAAGDLRADLDPELTYRFIRDTVWVAVRWYRPGGSPTAAEVADQYLTILFDGIAGTAGTAGAAPVVEAFIVEAVRTPVGRRRGSLSGVHSADLGAHVLRALVERSGVEPAAVDDVVMGCCDTIGSQAGDVARTAWLVAGLPDEVPGVTIDRQCGSSQQAVHFAAQGVMSGTQDLVVAGGLQNMSAIPISAAMLVAQQYGFSTPFAESPGWRERYGDAEISQFRSAEMIAEKWDVSRADMEAFALESHRRALSAIAEGRFEREIAPLGEAAVDECPRADTSPERMAALQPLLPDGRITAGVSSQISDGASAMLIASERAVSEHGLTPRARVHHLSVRGDDPVWMLTGPIRATRHALERSGMSVDDIDLFECNEAFASVVLAWERELGVPHEKVNVNGGAIALGHPIGATGTRLMTTLLHELERTGGRYGLQTMCEGGGQANVTIIERL